MGGRYRDEESKESLLKLSKLSGQMHCKSKLLSNSNENPGEIRQPDRLTPCRFLQL